MEAKMKQLRFSSIERTDDGEMYGVVSNLNVPKATLTLFFTIFEPFNENGLPDMKKPFFCDSFVQKECLILLN